MNTDTRRMFATLLIATVAALFWSNPVDAQRKSSGAAASKPAASSTVASANGEPITREELLNDLLADQAAQNAITRPEFLAFARSRQVAGAIGVLVVRKMSKYGWKPVTITRAEIAEWLFEDKPPVLSQLVERVIQEKLVAQAARKKGVTFTPQELDSRTKEAINTGRLQYHLGNVSDAEVLKTVGFRAETMKRTVSTALLLEKLILKEMEAKAGHAVAPADFIEASHLLVRVTGMEPGGKDKAFEDGLAKIKGYKAEIDSGKITFDAAAQQYSDDPSKFQKGSLGIFMRGMMVPEFEKAAFSLEPGKVSEPVKSPFGWHLIKVTRQGKDTTGPERKTVEQQYLRSHMQQFVMELVQKAKIVNPLAQPRPGGPMPMGGSDGR